MRRRIGQRKLTWLDRRRGWHWSTEYVPGAFYSDSRDVRRCNHCGSVIT